MPHSTQPHNCIILLVLTVSNEPGKAGFWANSPNGPFQLFIFNKNTFCIVYQDLGSLEKVVKLDIFVACSSSSRLNVIKQILKEG